MYWSPGVRGVAEGLRPRSARWEGVRGMSVRSSAGRKRGRQAIVMFRRKKACRARRA